MALLALNSWAWVKELTDIRPQGAPFPTNTFSSVKTITKLYPGWGGALFVSQWRWLSLLEEMDSAHSPQHFSPSHSSSWPGSYFDVGVMIPFKHDENLGLNVDFSHPEALKSNSPITKVFTYSEKYVHFIYFFYSCKTKKLLIHVHASGCCYDISIMLKNRI